MVRPKINGSGVFTIRLSFDHETYNKLEKLSEQLGLYNKSAVVRLAIRELYVRKLVRKE